MGSDLLRKFQEKKLPLGEELELELGLSLGGCFGGKPKESGLYRSSSSACTTTFCGDLSLTRTSSLPAASLQETKKRKGLMDIIQMEVMKKELEMKRCCRGGDGVVDDDNDAVLGLKGSQGSGSSGITELESQSAQAQATLNQNVTCQKNHTESSSPTSVLSSQEQPNVNTMCPKPIKMPDIKTESKTDNRKAKLKNSCTSALALDKNPTGIYPTDEMPHVFTRGDGPNGKRIEGFLFKYKKGEEIRIVCVCHGRFLTPAEFVKHAGGEELAHPLRRIVVVPSPSSLQ